MLTKPLLIALALNLFVSLAGANAQRSPFGNAGPYGNVSPYGTPGGVGSVSPFGVPGVVRYGANGVPYTQPLVPMYGVPGNYGYNYTNYGVGGIGGYVPTYGFNYPTLAQPALIGGNYFGLRIGSANLQMWKAPSGYYYPWCARPVGLLYPAPIVIYQQGTTQPQLPPLSTMFEDMIKYLNESKEKSKISEADYNHLKRRATDLKNKERSLAIAAGGSLPQDSDELLRKDADQLSEEMARRIKPF